MDYKKEYLYKWHNKYYPKDWQRNVDNWYGRNLDFEKKQGRTKFFPYLDYCSDSKIMLCIIEYGKGTKSIGVDVFFMRYFCDEVYYYTQQGIITNQEQYKDILKVMEGAYDFIYNKKSYITDNEEKEETKQVEVVCHPNKYIKDDKKTYLVKNNRNNLYKIGRSKNPMNREKTLQSEEPDIKLVKVWDNDIEKELHIKYNEQRVRGEWFALNKVQVRYICTHY